MNPRPIALAAALLAAGPLFAAEYNTVVADKSRIGFVYRQMGVPVEGRFGRLTAQLIFDPAKPAAARATLEVDLAGVDAGSAEANDEVAGKAWFNTKAFPMARFVASAIKPLGGKRYVADGQLTLKGRSKNLSVEFTLEPLGKEATVDGSFILRRADFAVGEGVWADFGTVANEIEVRFHLLATAGK